MILILIRFDLTLQKAIASTVEATALGGLIVTCAYMRKVCVSDAQDNA